MLTTADIHDVDWDKINEEANKNPVGKYDSTISKPKIWLKMNPGIHYLRIVPSGNQTERLPYLQTSEHKYVGTDENGRRIFGTINCWKHLYDNLMSKKTDQAKKENSLIAYLGMQNLLDQDNYRKYMEFGCPWCKAHQFMTIHGVDKEVRKLLWATTTYYWNVIHRANRGTGDDNVYIWRQSSAQFNSIINTLKIVKETGGENYLDVGAGRDLMLQADGNGLARRYPILQFVGHTSPLNLGDKTAHHLEANTLAKGWRTYQDSVNLLKQYHGTLLAQQGHIVLGDSALTSQYQYAANMVNDINKEIKEVVKTEVNPIKQAPVQPVGIAPFKDGDEIIVVNGKLVNKATGKEMF